MYNSLTQSSLNFGTKFTLTVSSKPSSQLGSSYEDLSICGREEHINTSDRWINTNLTPNCHCLGNLVRWRWNTTKDVKQKKIFPWFRCTKYVLYMYLTQQNLAILIPKLDQARFDMWVIVWLRALRSLSRQLFVYLFAYLVNSSIFPFIHLFYYIIISFLYSNSCYWDNSTYTSCNQFC